MTLSIAHPKPTSVTPSRGRAHMGTVCHVVHSLGVGGAEVLVADMIRSLSDRFRCVVACLDDIGPIGEQLMAEDIEVALLNRAPGIDWRCSRRLAAWCRANQVDILHAHQCTPMFQSLLSRQPGGRTPVLLTEHGRHHPDHPSFKRAFCHRLLLRSQDRLVAVGEATRTALIRNEGLPPDRVQVIYNGVDLEAYRDVPPETREQVRAELGFDAADLVITLVARFDAIKDHATAIRALKRVRKCVPSARLLLVGDGPERGVIEEIIRQLEVEEHVCLAGTRSDVPRLLPAADMFLMTSLGEGIPLTIIEAMAAGLPVVSTDVGGIPEMITSGENGLLHEVGDDAALAESMLKLHSDRTLREQIVHAGRARAFADFSREQMLNKYAAIYEEMLDGC